MPKGGEVITDPLVRPVGADTVVPFSQSKAKVVLYGGTTRDGFFFDGKLRGNNLQTSSEIALHTRSVVGIMFTNSSLTMLQRSIQIPMIISRH